MPSYLAVLLISNILPGDSRYGKLWWGFPGSERKYHPHHSFFRKKEGIQKLFLVWVVFNLCATEYQGACSHQSKRCCILKVDESMWEIVGASNLIGNTTLEQVRKRMAMEDVPDVSVSVIFYLQSWFIVVEVCDFFAPTTFCREVCAFVCESFWLDTTYM